MRASIRVETTGRPTVSIVCEGFEGQARATGRGHGFDDMALASTVGHVDAQDPATMESNLLAQTVNQVVVGLTSVAPNHAAATAAQPAPRDVAVTGTLDHINQEFLQRGWSDGLPIIPPTIGRVESFIAATGHDPCKQLGIAASSGRDITVWSIAVNAVMTGCDPQHLPVLLAMAEILADPHYGAEHSGNTTGADAIAIVSGPSMAQLGFNTGAGVLREGAHANTSVARWLRLYLRNVLGFTADQHDKATFGNSARMVLAEDMDTLTEIGWDVVASDFGVAAKQNAVTMARMNSGIIVGSVFGSSPEEILPYLSDALVRVSGWDLTHVYGLGQAQYRPLLVLSPILARTFAAAGWSKAQVQQALFAQARMRAWRFEKMVGEWSNLTAGRRTLVDMAAAGDVPAVFAESEDPERLVPIVTDPSKFVIAVAGDPNRTNAYVMSNDGPHGDWTARPVDLTPSTDPLCGTEQTG